LFGLPMADEALALYRAHTGRTVPPAAPFSEAALVIGRRGGKSRVLAAVAVYLATCRDYTPHLAPGEAATIGVLAADRRQARTIFRYAAGAVEGGSVAGRRASRGDDRDPDPDEQCRDRDRHGFASLDARLHVRRDPRRRVCLLAIGRHERQPGSRDHAGAAAGLGDHPRRDAAERQLALSQAGCSLGRVSPALRASGSGCTGSLTG
jgi:hypothetical protein